jgi:hypothetical protein
MKKRFMTFFMALMLLVTLFPVTARAESVFDKAVNMEELELYSESLNGEVNNGDKFIYYKISISEKGHIKFRYDECPQYTYAFLYDSNAELVGGYNRNGCFELTGDDPLLEEGVYYLKVVGERDDSHYKNLYYVFTPSEEPTIQFKITLKKGESLDLSAVVDPKNEKITWLSTKKTVATVSNTGKIKAIKAGTTKIYASLDNKTRIELTLVVNK